MIRASSSTRDSSRSASLCSTCKRGAIAPFDQGDLYKRCAAASAASICWSVWLGQVLTSTFVVGLMVLYAMRSSILDKVTARRVTLTAPRKEVLKAAAAALLKSS